MTTILFSLVWVVLVGAVVSLPFVLGLVLRLALKRVNARLLAALAGAVIFLLCARVSPWSEQDALATSVTRELAPEVDPPFRVLMFIIWVLASLGIPCLLAWAGVSIGEKIMRRKSPTT